MDQEELNKRVARSRSHLWLYIVLAAFILIVTSTVSFSIETRFGLQVLWLLIVLFVFGILYFQIKFMLAMNANTKTVQRLLNGKITKRYFGIIKIIEGQYKGKKIVVRYFNFIPFGMVSTNCWCYVYSPIEQPDLPIQPWFGVDIPKITPNTFYIRTPDSNQRGVGFFESSQRDPLLNKVTTGPLLSSNNYLVFWRLGEDVFVNIFEELIRAVDVFKADPEKYIQRIKKLFF